MKRNKRDERTEKRHGNAAHGPRRPTRRKACRSTKKQSKKSKRIKTECTICKNTSHGIRQVTICGHIFHRKCLRMWRKNGTNNCPICRADLPTNTGHHHRSNLLSVEDSLIYRPVPPVPPLPLTDHDNQDVDSDVSSPNLANSGIDLDNESSYSDNSITHSETFASSRRSNPSVEDNLPLRTRLVRPPSLRLLPTNTGNHLPSNELSVEEILADMTSPVPPPPLSLLPRPFSPLLLQDQDNQVVELEVYSPIVDNSDIDLDNDSSYSDNSIITHSVNSSSDSLNSSTNSEAPRDSDDQTD